MDNLNQAKKIGYHIGKEVQGTMIATAAAIEMAEWKDEQFKEYIQKKIDSLCELGCKTESLELQKTYADRMVVLGEIINELFKEN